MKAEILSVGTELLQGSSLDTNAPFLATQLLGLGIELHYMSIVGDDRERLAGAVACAWGRSDLTLTTGGLGPTEDDLTREAIAQVFGEEMVVDPALAQWLRQLFASRGIPMPERNIKQAMLIPSAQPLANPRGTAPGWWLERDGKLLVSMPGPPREMERMWEMEVLPRLKPKLGGVILSRTLKTFGIGEAAVDEALTPVLGSTNPYIGIYAKTDGIHVCITVKSPSEVEAQRLLSQMEVRVSGLLGEGLIWGQDKDTLEGVVGELLKAKGLTLAIMESCTGGLLSNVITDVPGSSDYFRGGLVAYTNSMKIAYGVEGELIARFGAVSAEVAMAMATAARRELGAEVGVGITGVAGPDPLEGKPPGIVYVGIDAQGQHFTTSLQYRFDRLRIKRAAVTATLVNLRRLLLQR